jgi:hypothetical protein
VYCTVPFGWKASAYIYQSVGLIQHTFVLLVFCAASTSTLIMLPLCEWSYLQKAGVAIYIATNFPRLYISFIEVGPNSQAI